ncbi:MAG: serine/threonine protein kinase, partial [Planctomycetaceae bacterium]|nr:serine/threonine protein kinase [Planctomycetaceae bacterium]
LRLTEILRIGHQLACGLAAAHKQGLIHRDIKPANILLENGVERVKITDFGLARLVDDVSITRTGEVSGTPQYMSPEQAAGDPVDHRSDLFSLGCVLYAMCTGRSPFRATSLAAAIRRVCDDVPRPIEEINPEIPAWLSDFINALLEKNPDARIQSAEEVAEFLGDRLAGLQHPPSLPKASVKTPPRPIPVRAVQPAPQVPSDARVGRGLIVIGAGILVLPWFAALLYRMIEGRPWNPAVGGQLLLTSSLGLLAMLLGGAVTRVFGRKESFGSGEGGGRPRSDLFGRLLILLGVLILAGVIVAFAYVAADFPDLPPFEGRDFGTIVIPIVLVGVWIVLTGLLLRGQLHGPSRAAVRRRNARPWDIRRVGRTAIWAGVSIFALPWLPILFGFIVGNGDPMEFGGSFIFPAAVVGVPTIMMGCIPLLVAYAVNPRPSEGGSSAHRGSERTPATARSPWNVLGWMIVGGMVLIPLLLVMLITSFVVTRKATMDRYNRAMTVDAARIQQSLQIAEAQRQRQPDVLRAEAERLSIQQRREWEAAATATFPFDPTALGNVGLSIYRTDADSANKVDDIRPSELLIRAGNLVMLQSFQAGAVNKIRLPPGEYEIRVHGREFGWSNGTAWLAMGGMFGDLPFEETTISNVATVNIPDDDDAHVSRLEYNWQDIARRPPRWTGSPATHNFYWNGTAYAVNLLQGQVIQKLLIAFAAGSPEVPKTDLAVDLNRIQGGRAGGFIPGDEDFDGGFGMMGMAAPLFVEAVFDHGRHPAWGTLIVPGHKEGHYRLAEPQIPPPLSAQPPEIGEVLDPFQLGPIESPQPLPPAKDPFTASPSPASEPSDRVGVLNVDIRDDGLIVALRRKSAFGGFVENSEQQVSDVGVTQLRLVPGDYEVIIRDDLFGPRGGSHAQDVRVGSAQPTDLRVTREFAKLKINLKGFDIAARSVTQFRWGGATYRVNLPQAVVLNRLLTVYETDEPSVDEADLLQSALVAAQRGRHQEHVEQATVASLEELFRGSQAWGGLIVPGETPGTYRLKPLLDSAPSTPSVEPQTEAPAIDNDARIERDDVAPTNESGDSTPPPPPMPLDDLPPGESLGRRGVRRTYEMCS